jgi:hypothetical protein
MLWTPGMLPFDLLPFSPTLPVRIMYHPNVSSRVTRIAHHNLDAISPLPHTPPYYQ